VLAQIFVVSISLFLPYPATARTSIETRLQRLEKNLIRIDALFEEQSNVLNKLHIVENKLLELNSKIAELELQVKTQQELLAQVAAPNKHHAPLLPLQTMESSVEEQHSEQVKFQYCVHLVKNKKIDEAFVAFEDFIWQYPSGALAVQAHFWLAELHLLRWSDDHNNTAARDEAIKQFRFVYSRFGEHPKAPDALLKLGLIMYEDGQLSKSKEILHELITKHANTSAATIAQAKLTAISNKTNSHQ
jgi:tol-pal system protein YbgF